MISRLKNAYPSRKKDTSHVKRFQNFDHADPHFNTPGKNNILLDTDILEHPFLHNKIEDNGLSLRDSFFGSVVSGHVVEGAQDLVVEYTSIMSSNDTEDLVC